jgi:putative inorganic carbon (HCO3(-)) transporter
VTLSIYGAVVTLGGWWAWQVVGAWTNASGAPGNDLVQTFEGRRELWGIAIAMLQDFPLTGIGLGQFNLVAQALYVPFVVAPGEFLPHAHNLYLEYALELGIPGAVAFACLIVVCLAQSTRAVRSTDAMLRWTGLGVSLSLLAYLVYGLTDAIAPGARGGVVLWVLLGYAAAVGNVARSLVGPDGPDGPEAAGRRRLLRHQVPSDPGESAGS